ncbi:MAG: hypothetical protein IPK19_06940 [Chloroflexi bacterium]|nr:hypothetical protein [Chloroflexota bacterium]
MSLAIACASGGYRVAFVQGVLSALERADVRADAYAGTSGSVIPAALAAIGRHDHHGLAYIEGLLEYKSLGKGMSGVFLESIQYWGTLVREQLWQPARPRLVLPASAVVTQEAADQVQTHASCHLGRRLLMEAARHDKHWANLHLRLELFDTHPVNSGRRLTPDNFAEVAYASSRMLHAWAVPAWIEDRPYVDASYTCSCPALELADMGYDEVVAITPECGPFYHDLFGTEEIPRVWKGTPVYIIQPEVDLTDFGVLCTQADEDGLHEAYRLGEAKGLQFLSGFISGWRQREALREIDVDKPRGIMLGDVRTAV